MRARQVVLTIVGKNIDVKRRNYFVLFKTRTLLDTIMTDSTGTVGFDLTIRIPDVFGTYSAVEVGLRLDIPGDPENFEELSNGYLERSLAYQRDAVNKIAVACGREAVFAEVKPEETAKETPEIKEASA